MNETAASPTEATSSAASQKCPSGCVERLLNFRERNLLIGAARDYCGKVDRHGNKEHGDYKNQSKLDRLAKLVAFSETLEYFEVINDHYEDVVRSWKRARLVYVAWMNLNSGLIKPEDFKREFPAVDPEKGVAKPALRMPEATPKEMRGDERAFYFPSKLDVWVQDLLRVVTFEPLAAEYAVELCSKFGIKDEDS